MELDKYLDQNKLCKQGKKKDKISAIAADVFRKKESFVVEETIQAVRSDECSDCCDIDEDLVLEKSGSETST